MKTLDSLISYGDAVKVLDEGRVGGYLVRFTNAASKDITGEYFTAKTYYGPRNGDGADMLFHHSRPIAGLMQLADHMFQPISTKVDDIGIWAEAVLDMSDQYESKVFALAKDGKLGWSSGAAAHMVRKSDDGEITRWPIAEGSLTPTPAEPRNKILNVKSLDQPEIKAELEGTKTLKEIEGLLRDAVGLSRADATALVSRIKSLGHGERESEAKQRDQLTAVFQRFRVA